jgi:hypothetical protein
MELFIHRSHLKEVCTRLSNRGQLSGLADAAKELLQKQQQDNPLLVAAAKVVIAVHDNPLLASIPCLEVALNFSILPDAVS